MACTLGGMRRSLRYCQVKRISTMTGMVLLTPQAAAVHLSMNAVSTASRTVNSRVTESAWSCVRHTHTHTHDSRCEQSGYDTCGRTGGGKRTPHLPNCLRAASTSRAMLSAHTAASASSTYSSIPARDPDHSLPTMSSPSSTHTSSSPSSVCDRGCRVVPCVCRVSCHACCGK